MNTPRIDVHAHFLPGFYREALVKAGQVHPDGMPAIPDWSEEAASKPWISWASRPLCYRSPLQASTLATRRQQTSLPGA